MTTVIALNANMDSNKSDIELVQFIINGDKSKFKELYNRNKRNVFLTCLRYAKNKSEAEDFLQDAFVNIYNSLHQYNPKKGKLISWMARVTVNTCLMHLRKKSMEFANTDITNGLATQQAQQENLESMENLSIQELTKIIQSLPDGYRTVFNMHVMDGYTHKEIAEYLGISESTSKSQLFKARKQLQTIIKTTTKEVKYG